MIHLLTKIVHGNIFTIKRDTFFHVFLVIWNICSTMTIWVFTCSIPRIMCCRRMWRGLLLTTCRTMPWRWNSTRARRPASPLTPLQRARGTLKARGVNTTLSTVESSRASQQPRGFILWMDVKWSSVKARPVIFPAISWLIQKKSLTLPMNKQKKQ